MKYSDPQKDWHCFIEVITKALKLQIQKSKNITIQPYDIYLYQRYWSKKIVTLHTYIGSE